MSKLLDNLLTRREAFKVGTSSLSAYWFLPLIAPTNVRAQGAANLRGTARFTIFVFLDGGQSHVDAWDLKEHQWTPPDFAIKEVQPGVKWPTSLYPKLGARMDRFALVRSLQAWDAVHGRAIYYAQTGHTLNPALEKEIPSIGSVVSYEYAQRRRPTDTLPTYVAFNVNGQAGLIKSGFLPATHSPFYVETSAGLNALTVDDNGRKEFMRRWELLKRFDARLRNDPSLEAKAYHDYHNYYEGAVSMMSDERASKAFKIDPVDRERYGKTELGDGCILARNLVEADGGTHFMMVQQAGWDHHNRIYGPNTHQKVSHELDTALTALLDDLETRKRKDGRSLLDETLVVCFGEFGRTPGPLSPTQGRDHHMYAFTGLFAGGGVKGGQVIGKTDDMGFNVVDSGTGVKRSLYMEDVATTIYSAMGIDAKKVVEGTPSGRAFHYIEPFAAQKIIGAREISQLFG
jgi:hypothetical protein